MGGQIECHGQAHLARREIAAVEGIAFGGRRETGILAHRPGTRDIHRRIRSTQERREAGHRIERLLDRADVGRRADRRHSNLLARHPRLRGRDAAERRRWHRLFIKGNLGKIRKVFHERTPARRCSWARVVRTLERTWMKSSNPAARNSASRSPGCPARTTLRAGLADLIRRAKTGASSG